MGGRGSALPDQALHIVSLGATVFQIPICQAFLAEPWFIRRLEENGLDANILDADNNDSSLDVVGLAIVRGHQPLKFLSPMDEEELIQWEYFLRHRTCCSVEVLSMNPTRDEISQPCLRIAPFIIRKLFWSGCP